jgi:hypothetical protein
MRAGFFISISFLLSVSFSLQLKAQYKNDTSTSAVLDSLNRFVDYCVVKKLKAALDTLYAEDFAFTHGTGKFDTKDSWLKAVMDTGTNYLSRQHDSITVEVHEKVAIVYGSLMVKTNRTNQWKSYGVRYVRVFTLRQNRWQLISHRTVKEWFYP